METVRTLLTLCKGMYIYILLYYLLYICNWLDFEILFNNKWCVYEKTNRFHKFRICGTIKRARRDKEIEIVQIYGSSRFSVWIWILNSNHRLTEETEIKKKMKILRWLACISLLKSMQTLGQSNAPEWKFYLLRALLPRHVTLLRAYVRVYGWERDNL